MFPENPYGEDVAAILKNFKNVGRRNISLQLELTEIEAEAITWFLVKLRRKED